MPPRRPNQPDWQPVADEAVAAFFRLTPRMRAVVVVLLLVAAAVAAVIYLRSQQRWTVPNQANGSPHMLLGNPSNAGGEPDNYLMVKPYFAEAYDNSTGEPKWVSWRLTAADLGRAPRRPEFASDDQLPANFYHVVDRDYSGSGFDRGHMCPHSDRAADEEMSYATFVMSNIIPQAPNVNQKAWAQVESYCREQARTRHRLYITSGPEGAGGVGRNGPRSTIAGGRVVVPAGCWKIALIVPEDGVDPDPSTITTARVLAVDMPNDQRSVGESWSQYRTSPAAIEAKTGLHFFDRLRPDVAATLREAVDRADLPPPIRLEHE